MPKHKYTNELINETSPYLLQHAHNPVNWKPWGKDALKQAKGEDKLMIISVGYSACHWCHVMEHESFEDTTVAQLMNDNFVSIKVDREERPDVDQVYMDAAYIVTGSGGWPLNAIALPDGRAVFAGTYFRKERWMKTLEYFAEMWEEDPGRMMEQADKIHERASTLELKPNTTNHKTVTEEDLQQTFKVWYPAFDKKWGGKSGAPKFPMPNNYRYLLAYNYNSSNTEALKAVTAALNGMANGGIYDHIGGGFARYSVDGEWHVPHFEKMLYDNAQLITLYAEAYQATKKESYKKIVEESIDFLKREMTSPENGLYSAYDADSEGEEGKFYVWQKSEIDKLLGEESAWFCDYYDVREEGNWEHKNVLRILDDKADILKKYKLSEAVFEKKLANAKQTLFAERAKRVWPGLDDKILLSWNSMAVSGLVKAYRALGDENYLETALDNIEFIENKLIKEDYSVFRTYKEGISKINGFLDDYSFTAEALIDLYEVTFDEQYLFKAQKLSEYAIDHFYDDSTGFFFYTDKDDDPLTLRKKEISDNVIPASNSSMFKALYRLSLYFDLAQWRLMSEKAALKMKDQALVSPLFNSNWLMLMQWMVNEPYEVAIVGENWKELRKQLDDHYLPNVFLMGGQNEGSLSLLKNKLVKGQTTIYVCKQKTCKRPVTDVDEALEMVR